MRRTFKDYIEDIINSIQEIKEFSAGMVFNEFVKDKKTINAVIRSLEVMGEAAKKIPAEIKNKYPKIPWNYMAGMRDKLIHEYHGVDLEIVWEVVEKDIQNIEPYLKKILEELKE